MMKYDINKIKNELDNSGFTFVKNIFSEEEMNHLKSISHKECSLVDYKKGVSGDVINNKNIRNIIFKDSVIDIMRSIVNNKDLVYTFDSQIHCKPNRRIFHTDARNDEVNPRKNNYPIYRLGIFLQDHKDYSGGIKFRKNSHRRHIINKHLIKNILLGKQNLSDPISFFNFGKIVNARTEVGDLGIWSLRTEHSGGAVIPKLFSNIAFLPFIDNLIPSILKKPEHENRVAIFYTFGEASNCLNNYIDYKIKNDKDKEHWEKSFIDNDVMQFTEKKGFSIHQKLFDLLK